MLTSLRVWNWKSFAGAEKDAPTIPIAPLTFLVGANGSGKSNLLEAIRFLQGIAFDFSYQQVLQGVSSGGIQICQPIRGGVREAAANGADYFGIDAQYDFGNDRRFEHVLSVGTHQAVHTNFERFLAAGELLVETDMRRTAPSGDDDPLLYVRESSRLPYGDPAKASAQVSMKRSIEGQIDRLSGLGPRVIEALRLMKDRLRAVIFLDFDPDVMRQPSSTPPQTLGRSGENLPGVLKQLDENTRADLVDWLSELCAPKIDDITFSEARKADKVYFLLQEANGSTISAESASDGTLRFLGLLTALTTCEKGSIVIIEEPDLGLHPSRIHLLAEFLEDVVQRRGIQLIATTHSPALLAHLSERALHDVIAIDRDPATGGSIAKRVGDLPNFTVLAGSKDRDHLISTGWLERAV
jgi:predicted ATPase